MRIAVDLRFLARGGYSGVEEYARQLLPELITAGSHHCWRLFYAGLNSLPPPSSWLEPSHVELVNWRLPNKLLDFSFRLFNRPRLPADLLYSPHLNYLPDGQPRLLTVHDLSFFHYPEFFSWRGRLWHRLQNIKKQSRRAVRVIADSEFTKSDLVELCGLPPSKISVVYPGLSREFEPLPASDANLLAWRSRSGLNHPFLLYLGSLEPRKNVIAVVRAFNLLKSDPAFRALGLVLAGGKSWLEAETEQTIRSSPFRSDIKVLKNLVPAERILLYNSATAFVYPSFFEGFGFPPLEAQACGLPVIASNRASLPEVLADSALLVDPWRLRELVEAIRSVLVDDSVRRRLVADGFANSSRFSWPDTARQILSIISNL